MCVGTGWLNLELGHFGCFAMVASDPRVAAELLEYYRRAADEAHARALFPRQSRTYFPYFFRLGDRLHPRRTRYYTHSSTGLLVRV